MLYTAAGEQYLKIEDVVETPALQFFMFMNFYIKKSELEANRIKNSMR